jgi:N-dimethylarginine dimethylaminohydrolase
MASPKHFRIAYAINPHMMRGDGSLQAVDQVRAVQQWNAVRRAYESLGYPVTVLPADPDLPDQVFTANPAFVVPRVGMKGLMFSSRMRHQVRAREAHLVSSALRETKESREFPESVGCVEGHGDLLWHPTRRLLFAGFGFRTDFAVLTWLSQSLAAPILGFELKDPRFYHLDTCLCPIDESTALFSREAFTEEGVALLERAFPSLIEVPSMEAGGAMACNAHSPDGRSVLVEAAAVATAELVRRGGFLSVPLDTSEFRKAGGSIFCMKLMIP